MHIAIAGNIGSGKTTLTNMLSEHFNWGTHYEDVESNPYLSDFYGDMPRWSFNLQVYFLNSRFRQVMDIRASGKSVIQDRSIYEDALIFAPNLHDMGLMSPRDFENYTSLFGLMQTLVAPPDLLIYLKASIPTLLRQIQNRGRDYESTIDEKYLTNLNQRYDNWIQNYKGQNLLVLDVDNLEFPTVKADMDFIIEKVNDKLVVNS